MPPWQAEGGGPAAASAGRLNSGVFGGWPGSPIGSLTGGRRPQSPSHTQLTCEDVTSGLRVIATTAHEQPVAAFCGALLIRPSQVFRAVCWRGYMPGTEAYCTASSACTLT